MPKRIIPIVILGEKDHGKSSLLGRFLYETGSIPKDRIRDARGIAHKLGKKFEWAHLLDSFRYERERGMTLDTTRAAVKLHGNLYDFIDVPGHKELIRNMLTGAADARYAILVVAADRGVEPQTLRHIHLARMLGIRKILIVLNKCDTLNYSKERFALLARDIRLHVRRAGFRGPLVIPVVAREGENLLKRSERMRWFKGPTLAEALQSHLSAFPRTIAASLIAPIQDVYRPAIAVGRVESGRITTGDTVYLLPYGSRHRVKELFSGGKSIRTAIPRAAVEFVLDPTPKNVRRGDLISKKRLRTSYVVRCRCFLLKAPRGKSNLLVELFFKHIRIRAIKGHAAVHVPVTLTLFLADAVAVPAKFAIREKGTIIGFGRILRIL